MSFEEDARHQDSGQEGFLDARDFRAAVDWSPLIAIDLLIQHPRTAKVLLGLRRNPPAAGSWFVPGGRIRKGERLKSAWHRLCWEELGTTLPWSTKQLAGIFEHFYPDNFLGESATTHYVVLAYRATLDHLPAGLPAQQHQRFEWWSVDELIDSDAVHPYTRAYFSSAMPAAHESMD